jgi:hypothetical protein
MLTVRANNKKVSGTHELKFRVLPAQQQMRLQPAPRPSASKIRLLILVAERVQRALVVNSRSAGDELWAVSKFRERARPKKAREQSWFGRCLDYPSRAAAHTATHTLHTKRYV